MTHCSISFSYLGAPPDAVGLLRGLAGDLPRAQERLYHISTMIVCVYIYIYIYMYICTYIYIYIYVVVDYELLY